MFQFAGWTLQTFPMRKGVPPQITAAPLEARIIPYGDAVTAGETHRKSTAGSAEHENVVVEIDGG